MGKGKRTSSKGKSHRSSSHAEAGARYSAPKSGVSGVLNGVPAPVIFVFSGIEVIMGLVFIIIGSINLDRCNIEPMIPIWLIMMGCVMIVTAAHEGFQYFRRSKAVSHGRGLVSLILTFTLVLIMLGLFIAGNVFVYVAWAADPDFGHIWRVNGCDHATFNLAFISVIVMDAMLGLLVLAIFFFAIYQACGGKK